MAQPLIVLLTVCLAAGLMGEKAEETVMTWSPGPKPTSVLRGEYTSGAACSPGQTTWDQVCIKK